MTKMGQKYANDSAKDPGLENMFKSVINFQQNETAAANDPDLKEIQQIIKSVLKDDLKIETPVDMMLFGLKLMANTNETRSEMIDLKEQLEERIKEYYDKKWYPIYNQMNREFGELMMVEGVRYLKEIIYLIWMVFSLALCSGIAIENPVLERETKIRYYLNVLGLG